MSIANPISANQVVDVAIDKKCLPITCFNLPNVLQALVDKVCAEGPDYTDLDLKCTRPTTLTLIDILQGIIDELPCDPIVPPVPGSPGYPNATGYQVNNITNCTTDNWDCGSLNACFNLTDPCNPTVLTVGHLFQILIDRNVAYGNVIKTLCTQIASLQSQVNTIQLTVNTIQTTCCP